MNPRPNAFDSHSGHSPEEAAALYAAGALEPPEARAFEAHLTGGCEDCQAALRSLEATVDALIADVVPVAPSPRLKERVLAAAQARPWTLWPADAQQEGIFTLPAEQQGAWQPTGFPGVAVKRLFVDPAADRVTALFRMEPGACYPAHRHAGPEECLVVEGDLRAGERTLRAGDFQRAAAGSLHEVQSTTRGCVLLITGSMRDELFGSAA